MARAKKTSSLDAFIERENRTTVAAIIAIVAIVIVVATIMKVQPFDIFGSQGNLQGSASAESFVGTRYVDLVSHEGLEAKASFGKGMTRTYTAYLDEQVLVISWPGGYSQAMLETDAEGIYFTDYMDGEKSVSVVIVEPTLQLILDGLLDTEQVLSFSLVPKKVFDGVLTVTGEDYYFQMSGYTLYVSYEGGRDEIKLTPGEDGMLAGVWYVGEESRPIKLNIEESLLIIDNFY